MVVEASLVYIICYLLFLLGGLNIFFSDRYTKYVVNIGNDVIIRIVMNGNIVCIPFISWCAISSIGGSIPSPPIGIGIGIGIQSLKFM